MKAKDKARFVRNLCGSIRDEIMGKIQDGRIPEDWDGLELRALLAEKFQAETRGDLLKGKRQREYRNAVLTKYL